MAMSDATYLRPTMPNRIPDARIVGIDDLKTALAKGYADFMAMPSHLIFVGLIYPILGVFLSSFAFGEATMPLLFPLASGFALVGPLAGIGLYELSRRRERGEVPTWTDAFAVLRGPSISAILGMGVVLVVIFLLWLATAYGLFSAIMGQRANASYPDLIREILTTGRGWALILVGNAVGLAFAILVLTVSVIAFPMILDRNVGIGTAMETSRKVVLANPAPWRPGARSSPGCSRSAQSRSSSVSRS
ncbi:DUF2189 domain-containing protein [uncultured Enterovirga sp.]|uniref:DUF2189 domain-containing protein n=1 Tax=uncultured Enterovirga sp. TaxID=2026352 RepID=UPI0035CB1D01